MPVTSSLARPAWRFRSSQTWRAMPPCRSASTSRRAPSRSPSPFNKSPKGVFKTDIRYDGVPLFADTAAHVSPTGRFKTTPKTAAVLNRLGIEFDARIAKNLATTPQEANLFSRFRIKVGYSPYPIMHPYDIPWFGRDGHPSARTRLAKYERMIREEPLWVWAVVYQKKTAVVRTMVQRRLVSSVYTALENMGYGPKGVGKDDRPSIVGTVFLASYDCLAFANMDAAEFGKGVAQALVARQAMMERAQPKPARETPERHGNAQTVRLNSLNNSTSDISTDQKTSIPTNQTAGPAAHQNTSLSDILNTLNRMSKQAGSSMSREAEEFRRTLTKAWTAKQAGWKPPRRDKARVDHASILEILSSPSKNDRLSSNQKSSDSRTKWFDDLFADESVARKGNQTTSARRRQDRRQWQDEERPNSERLGRTRTHPAMRDAAHSRKETGRLKATDQNYSRRNLGPGSSGFSP